jgi:hypothetical protein
VHYNLVHGATRAGHQQLNSAPENASRGSAPAGVQKRDPPSGSDQVHRYAVGDGNGEKYSARSRGPAVDTLELDPAPAGFKVHEFDAMHLITEDDGLELGELAPKAEPARHDVSDRLPAPESQIEASPGIGAAACDARDDAILLLPAWYFKAWDGSSHRNFLDR